MSVLPKKTLTLILLIYLHFLVHVLPSQVSGITSFNELLAEVSDKRVDVESRSDPRLKVGQKNKNMRSKITEGITANTSMDLLNQDIIEDSLQDIETSPCVKNELHLKMPVTHRCCNEA